MNGNTTAKFLRSFWSAHNVLDRNGTSEDMAGKRGRKAWPAGGREDLPRWTAEGCALAATSTTWPLCITSSDCYWCRFEKQSHHTSLSCPLSASLPLVLSVRSTKQLFLKHQCSTDISFLLLLLLPSMISNDRQTNKEFAETESEDVLEFSRIEPLHHLLVVLSENVEEDGLLSSKPRTQRERVISWFNINPLSFIHRNDAR